MSRILLSTLILLLPLSAYAENWVSSIKDSTGNQDYQLIDQDRIQVQGNEVVFWVKAMTENQNPTVSQAQKSAWGELPHMVINRSAVNCNTHEFATFEAVAYREDGSVIRRMTETDPTWRAIIPGTSAEIYRQRLCKNDTPLNQTLLDQSAPSGNNTTPPAAGPDDNPAPESVQ